MGDSDVRGRGSHPFRRKTHRWACTGLTVAACLLQRSAGLLGGRRSVGYSAGPGAGIASRKKGEVLPALCNRLLKGKHYKAMWEAASGSAKRVFGGCFLPSEKQDWQMLRTLETGRWIGAPGPRLNPKSRDNYAEARRLCGLTWWPIRDKGAVTATPGPAGRTPPPLPVHGGPGPPQGQGPRPHQSCVRPPAQWPHTKAGKTKGGTWMQVKGVCGSETRRIGTPVGPGLIGEGERAPGHPACRPPPPWQHRQATHTLRGPGLWSRLPTDIAG